MSETWGVRDGEMVVVGGHSGKMREQYVSTVTPLKVTEMPGHPARRGESNHTASV